MQSQVPSGLPVCRLAVQLGASRHLGSGRVAWHAWHGTHGSPLVPTAFSDHWVGARTAPARLRGTGLWETGTDGIQKSPASSTVGQRTENICAGSYKAGGVLGSKADAWLRWA